MITTGTYQDRINIEDNIVKELCFKNNNIMLFKHCYQRLPDFQYLDIRPFDIKLNSLFIFRSFLYLETLSDIIFQTDSAPP